MNHSQKSLLTLLSTLVSSLAAANTTPVNEVKNFPSAGNSATYDIKVTSGGKTQDMTLLKEVLSVDEKTGIFKVRNTVSVGRKSKVSIETASISEFKELSENNKNCGNGAANESLSIKNGMTLSTCHAEKPGYSKDGLPFKVDNWLAKVPFGVAKTRLNTSTEVSEMTLKSYK